MYVIDSPFSRICVLNANDIFGLKVIEEPMFISHSNIKFIDEPNVYLMKLNELNKEQEKL